jgi:hypothetical protein
MKSRCRRRARSQRVDADQCPRAGQLGRDGSCDTPGDEPAHEARLAGAFGSALRRGRSRAEALPAVSPGRCGTRPCASAPATRNRDARAPAAPPERKSARDAPPAAAPRTPVSGDGPPSATASGGLSGVEGSRSGSRGKVDTASDTKPLASHPGTAQNARKAAESRTRRRAERTDMGEAPAQLRATDHGRAFPIYDQLRTQRSSSGRFAAVTSRRARR